MLCALTLFAQAPEKFSYQAVVRNASNALVTNAPVGVRVSILQGSASGNAVYVETHTASTNANGLLTVEIGGGTVQQGSFAGIDWANGPFFLKTETDPAGGSNYTVTSVQQLMSVPYALYAEEAGNGFSGDYNDLTNKPTITQNVGDLTNDAGYITQNDLPDIPTVPTNVSSFINDAGYVTMDSIPAQVNADWNATEGPAMILNKPQNASFGHGIVRLKVNNAVGDTNIVVGFSNYTLMNGGVVSISFTNDVPAGATLDINEQGAKPIHYRGPALTGGDIKANDRCLFMYNASGNRYYLIANDRWGVDLDALATVAHTGSYNDLTDKPTIPEVPTNISAFVNDAGYLTAIPDSFGGISLETDPIFTAWNKDYNDLTNKPNLAPVATSGDYNDLTNKPTIPEVPTNISAFVNDAGYITAIPDSFGGISLETDPIFTAWNKDYNDLINRPNLAPVATSGDYNDLSSKPVNADFGHGIVRTNVNNPAGATDINVTFTGYQLMNGGVVSLAFTRNVPAGATLNINGQGAKAIRWKGIALTDGVIKAGDRCLFMYNSGNNSYYLLANDRWGVDIDALATVAHTGSYNDLTDKPELFSGDYNDLTNTPTIPTEVSAFINDAGYITQDQIPAQVNADWNATNGPAEILNKPTIPAVPTNISAFVNDMGYITAIPDSLGGISIESDPIFSAWDKDYNDLINRPELFSGDYNDLTNKPTNADFGHGIVRTNVNNAAGATDINVTFTGYQLMNGGVVSLAFTRDVPAGATLNINGQGAKAIRWKGTALTDGIIKAGDRCLFMYNSGNNSYYLLANDRWGVDIDALATVAHTGSYNDLTDKPDLAPVATSGNYNDLTNTPTIPTVPTNVSDFNNDAGYITSDDIPAQVNADWNATEGAAQILNKPDLAPVATSGNYNDLTDKPTIPTVPTNVSAFVNDMGYLTSIPDSFGGISIESDPVFSNWDRDYNSLTNLPNLAPVATSGDYNDLTNKPNLAPVATSGNYNDLTNKPTNADFGHGLVRTNVNNAAGATDINVTFTGYQLMNGGVVSLAFTRNVPAGATLNINGQGAKAIRWKGTALTDGIIKAGDRCLFMYNSGNNSYFLLANDRWGSDIDALATVAFTGNYNDLTNTPELFSGNYNDLTDKPTIPTIPENVSAFNNDAGYITEYTETDPVFTNWNKDYNDLINKPVNADFGQGLVRTNVNNAAGATDIAVTFTGYQLVTGGVVSLAFTRNVPAGATLNINGQGAKPIRWKGVALTDGVIKAGDRCLFMYNSGNNSYYLLANDRWGVDIDALATVAHTGNYNDLDGRPSIPTHISDLDNDRGCITLSDIPAQVQSDWEETNISSPAYILRKPDLSNYLTTADLAGYVTETDLNNYVTKTEDESIGGDKTFTDNVSVAATGSLEVPSVLNSVGTDGSLTVNGTGNCEQAVNFCDLETLYQSMLNKFNDLNDQIDDLLDSIQKLNREQNAPQDGAPCPNTPTVTDNNGLYTYSTVRIGNQCWMRENLRGTTTSSSSYVSSGGSTPTYSTTDPLYVYPNLSSNNQVQYGLLYNYPAAQAICPPGWRLPSSADWAELRNYMEAKNGDRYYAQALGFTEGWANSEFENEVGYLDGANNNAMGFSAKPAGIYPLTSYFAPYANGQYGGQNGFSYTANFWSSDKLPFGISYFGSWISIGFGGSSSSDIGSSTAANSVYMSVRCICKNSNGEASTLKPLEVETNEPNSSNIYNRNVVSGSVSLTIKPGTITSNDSMPPATNISKYGFVYSHTVSGTNTLKVGVSNVNSENFTTLSSSNQPTSYPFEMTSYDLTGLTSGYVYYYRAYAIRGADTVYGDVKQFTADSDPNSCKTKINSSYPEQVPDQSDESIIYPTVAIGSQCWLAENLRAYKYAGDGTSLVHLTDYFSPSGGSSNGAGYLYTFNAATGGTVLTTSTTGVQGVCPAGWHVPTPDEFATLRTTMQGQSSYQCGGTSSNIAAALASTSGWNSSSTSCAPGNNPSSNNASGFNAYPAGFYNGSAIYYGNAVRFRTTTSGQLYGLANNSSKFLEMGGYDDTYGYSVRCIYGAAAPSVATGTASYSSISSTSAANPTFSYSVSSNILHNTGGNTSSWEKGVCYSTSSNPTLSNSKVTVSGSSTGTFTATLSSLSVGTTYYYRAYAKNAKGISYGEVKSFTTATLASVATIHSKYDATNTSVNLKANVTNTGGNTITSRVIQIRTAPYPDGSVVKTGTVSGNGSGYYEYNFTGLTAGTKYYAHAYVVQSINGTTVYRHASNSDYEFMLGTKPAVSMSSVTYTGNVCNTVMNYKYTANLTNAGTPTITKKGFVISETNSSPTLRSGQYDYIFPVSGTSTGQFIYNDYWYSYDANKMIYVRAYAINALDTVYSSVMTYRTRSVPNIWLATNYSDVYYYSSEVQNYTSGSTTKSKIRMSVGFTATTESSTTGANTGTCQQGLVYSTSPMSVTSSSEPSDLGGTVITLSSSESTSGYGSYYIENLSPNTKYYIRAWGKNDAGYGYSAERVVRTPVVCGNTLHDQDGNTYSTVKMGSKCWMKQNIKATHYDNTLNQFETGSGTSITPQTGTNVSFTNRYSYYPNGNSSNVSGYGLLYNWAAATGQGVILSYTSNSYSNNNMTSSTGNYNQGICPRGWHVPTSDEITSLVTALGTTSNMSNFNWQQRAGRLWGNTASPKYEEFNSYLELRGTTVSSNTDNSAGMYISSSPNAYTYSGGTDKRNGTSVRCVQDINY